jgi:hypothetical protein
MIYTCIGKRKGEHGKPFQCTATSETPSNPNRADWGFLCFECSSTRYGRSPLHVEAPDGDTPNEYEPEPVELLHGRFERVEESEAEEMDHLIELDLT